MKLGILDYAPIDEGNTAVQAVRQSRDLVELAEEHGYQRFWLAEHHGISALASVSPEVLIANHAAVTERIRIGSGGVMIPNYSAMKVAENFRQLSALSPGRIDLGVGRTTGAADPRFTRALNDQTAGTLTFEKKMDNILGFFTGDHPEESEYRALRAGPVTDQSPTPFVLGAGGSTAPYAGERGIGFTFAHFINGSKRGVRAARVYRDAFRPSPFLDRPNLIVAVFVAVGDTEAEAEELANTLHLWMARIETGTHFASLPPVEYAAGQRLTDREKSARERNESRLIWGTAGRVVRQLRELGDAYGADEVMVNPLVPGAENRRRTIAAIAEANAHG